MVCQNSQLQLILNRKKHLPVAIDSQLHSSKNHAKNSDLKRFIFRK
jgi:hypothetical protein